MPYADIDDVRYYYQSAGAGDPLLLLHGFTGNSRNWPAQVEVFARRHLTITVDLIGHGRSESPAGVRRYRMENVASDVVALVREIASGPVNLIGYSMGGRLALYLALARPTFVKALVLESASPGLESMAARQARVRKDELLARSIMRDGIAEFVRRWEKMPVLASQARLAASARAGLRRQRLRNSAVGLANSLRGMGTGAQESLWSRLHDLHIPVLLLAGELDHKFVVLAKEMGELLPCAQVKVVSQAGHTIHLEKPAQFNRIVSRFLGELE